MTLTPSDRRALRSDLARDNKLWKMGYDAGLTERKGLAKAAVFAAVLLGLQRHLFATVLVVLFLAVAVAALAVEFWWAVLAGGLLVAGFRLLRGPKVVEVEVPAALEPFPDDGRDEA